MADADVGKDENQNLRSDDELDAKYEKIDSKEYDFLLKVLLLGDSNVGKTCICRRYNGDQLVPLGSTVGIDFIQKRLKRTLLPKAKKGIDLNVFGDIQKISLQMWDTAGQERYKSLCDVFLRDAMGFLIVFDLSNEQTFTNSTSWIQKVQENSFSNDPDIILVGNKSDLPHQVTESSIKKLVEITGIEYVETSAMNDENVDFAVHRLIDKIMLRMETAINGNSLQEVIELSRKAADKNSCNC